LCCSETGGFRFHSNYDNGPAWRRNESRSLSLMSALRVNSGTGTHSAIPPKSGIVYRFSTGEQLADSKHHAILAEFVRGSQRLSASGSKANFTVFFHSNGLCVALPLHERLDTLPETPAGSSRHVA
jgi:hypothetical protein